jgi:hypothetical protein
MRAARARRAARAALLTGFLARVPGLAGFFAVVAAELLCCADGLGEVDELPELWPPAGGTVISKASAPASKRCKGGAEVGELKNLMPSL